MSNYKKGAKDLAFDKERAKYNKQIRELEAILRENDKTIAIQTEIIEKNSEEINQLKDWVRRLLEYTELSEDDMKKLIDNEKKYIELAEHMSNIAQVFSKFHVK